MKIAIGKPSQVRGLWLPFPPENLTPSEIREMLGELYALEEDAQNQGSFSDECEVRLVTLNRTVLDQVTSQHAKMVGHITFEDVFVFTNGRLVPLLELHTEEWLSHSHLGSILELGYFDQGILGSD